MPILQWKVFYDDGTTFSDRDGSAAEAPPVGVQAILQQADPAIGTRICARFDFYWFDRGEWHGSDVFGLHDYLMRACPSIVKFGRVMPRLAFEAVMGRVTTDPDFLEKTAWDPKEPR